MRVPPATQLVRPTTRVAASLGAAVLAAAVLAGCGSKHEDAGDPSWARDVHLGHGMLSFADGAVVVKGGGANARIAANGDLTIDGQPVAVDAAQRARLVGYHDAAYAMRAHAVDTAKAGLDVGKAVVGEVLHGLAKGDTSGIEKTAETKAAGVKLAALKLCDDLGAIRSAQDGVAATLPAFKPFAFVDQAEIDDCRKDLTPAPGTTMAGPAAPPAPAGAPAAPAPEPPAGATAPVKPGPASAGGAAPSAAGP